jgi:hypothetical protein
LSLDNLHVAWDLTGLHLARATWLGEGISPECGRLQVVTNFVAQVFEDLVQLDMGSLCYRNWADTVWQRSAIAFFQVCCSLQRGLALNMHSTTFCYQDPVQGHKQAPCGFQLASIWC